MNASLVGDTWMINGDANANDIRLWQTGADKFKGWDGTATITEQSNVQNIIVNLGGGDDTITFDSEDNSGTAKEAFKPGGNVIVTDSGGGGDKVVIADNGNQGQGEIGGDLLVDVAGGTTDGADTVNIDAVKVKGKLTIETGSGSATAGDAINIGTNAGGSADPSNVGVAVEGDLRVTADASQQPIDISIATEEAVTVGTVAASANVSIDVAATPDLEIGDDTAATPRLTVYGDVTIEGGTATGYGALYDIRQAAIVGSLQVTMGDVVVGAGANVVNIGKGVAPGVTVGVAPDAQDVTIRGGAGPDYVNVITSGITGRLDVRTRRGFDVITIDGTGGAPVNTKRIHVDGGKGGDTVLIGQGAATLVDPNAPTAINTGAFGAIARKARFRGSRGRDIFLVGGAATNFNNILKVKGGPQRDPLTFTTATGIGTAAKRGKVKWHPGNANAIPAVGEANLVNAAGGLAPKIRTFRKGIFRGLR